MHILAKSHGKLWRNRKWGSDVITLALAKAVPWPCGTRALERLESGRSGHRPASDEVCVRGTGKGGFGTKGFGVVGSGLRRCAGAAAGRGVYGTRPGAELDSHRGPL